MVEHMTIGIIPARGGSKGVEGKNMRLLAGNPLIYYMIQAAKQSDLIDDLYVSTDDKLIAEYSESLGAKTIIHNPILSVDNAPTFGVIQNALKYLKSIELNPNVLVTMRATSPLCIGSDIDSAISLLYSSEEIDAVISVAKSPVHPYRILRIDQDGFLLHYGETTENRYPQQRQSFSDVYIRNGAIYASRVRTIHAGGLWGSKTLPYIMPPERSVNINTELDFVLAQALVQR